LHAASMILSAVKVSAVARMIARGTVHGQSN
jgi:hypothetical protein